MLHSSARKTVGEWVSLMGADICAWYLRQSLNGPWISSLPFSSSSPSTSLHPRIFIITIRQWWNCRIIVFFKNWRDRFFLRKIEYYRFQRDSWDERFDSWNNIPRFFAHSNVDSFRLTGLWRREEIKEIRRERVFLSRRNNLLFLVASLTWTTF